MDIWDCHQQNSNYPQYKTNSLGILLLFDLTNDSSFQFIKELYFQLSNELKNVVFLLVGCKSDLKHLKTVSNSEIKKFTEEAQISYVKCSALNGEGVLDAFEKLLA